MALAVGIATVVIAAPAAAVAQECDGFSRTNDDGALELAQDCGSADATQNARAAAGQVLSGLAPDLGVDAQDLTVVDVNRSPGGRAVRFQQSFGGVPVFDGQIVVSLGGDNAVDMVLSSATTAAAPDLEPSLSEADALSLAIAKVAGGSDARGLPNAELVVYAPGVRPVLAWHVTVPTIAPAADWNLMLDADSGAVLDSWNAIAEVTGTGLVFSPNPIQKTGSTAFTDGAGLGDTDSAALDAARSSLPLTNLAVGNTLKGDFADMTGTGIDQLLTLPYTPGTANEPTRTYNYQRSDDRFEEANVYYAITEAQKLIQSLGFAAANNRSIPVDVHYGTEDNSFYSSDDHALHFGDGGVDDAEDGDIVLHEYGHSIQDNQVPGWGPGSNTEQRAIGEGFGDVFAAMFYMGSGNATYEASVGRYCVGEWDAVSYNPVAPGNPGSGCLRWINGRDEAAGADIGAYSGTPTEEHDDGRYWSAAMTCVFDGMGSDLAARNTLLRLVFDSQTRLVPTEATTAFEDQVASMLVSDGNLFNFSHQALIRSCASARNIATLPDPTPPPPPPPDTAAPDTTITKSPAAKTTKKRATFEFVASEAGASFQCSVDGAPFAACVSPVSLTVKKGKHEFRVQAVDAAGNADLTPASAAWKFKKKHRRHQGHGHH